MNRCAETGNLCVITELVILGSFCWYRHLCIHWYISWDPYTSYFSVFVKENTGNLLDIHMYL